MITHIDINLKSDKIELANILLTYIPNRTLMRLILSWQWRWSKGRAYSNSLMTPVHGV